MNCRDAERLIDTFFDGELDGRLMRQAALHVTRCRRCESEVQDRERIHDVLHGSVEAEIADLDLSAIWRGVEAALDRDPPARSVAPWRLAAASVGAGNLLRRRRAPGGGSVPERTGLRATGMIALAASLALAVTLAFQQQEPDSPGGESVAQGSPTDGAIRLATAPQRRAPVVRGPVLAAGLGGSSLVRPVASRSPRRGGQVQIESVDSRAGAMAMWSVPASDTAVIWVGASEPRTRQVPAAR